MLTKEKMVEIALKEIETDLASLRSKKTVSVFEPESNSFDNCGKCLKGCCDYRN